MKLLPFKDHIAKHEKLFKWSPLLYKHLPELMLHQLKGCALRRIDVYENDYDSTDQEYWYNNDDYLMGTDSTGMFLKRFLYV